MSSLIDTLNNISFIIYLYVGVVEEVASTVSNGLTIMVFSRAPLRATRTSLSVITLAVMNMLFLSYALISRAIAAAYRQFDFTFGNSILCAARYFIPNTTMSIIFFLLSWIAFDR